MPQQLSYSNYYLCLFHRLVTVTLLAIGMALLTSNAHSNGSIQIQYLQDSSDTEDIFIDLDTDMSKKFSLFAGTGKTRSPASSTDIDLDYWNIGLGYKVNKAFDIEFEAGNFGQGRDINVDTIDVQLRWSSDDWAFSLKPQYDEIGVLITTNNRIRTFDSTGIGVALDYYGMQNWQYSLAYDTYDYSINPRLLSIPFFVAQISSKALLVTSGLRDEVFAADITYLFPESDLTFTYARSTSAIDQTSSDIYSLAFDFYRYLPYKFGIEIGSVGSDIDTADYYGGFTLGYAW
jgi:hypothetical protein